MDAFLCGILPPTLPRSLDPGRGGPGSPPLVRRVEALGEEVARLGPDAVILACARWVTTFHHYVASAAGWHSVAGSCRPGDLDRPGDWPGDPELARALVETGTAARIPVVLTEEPALPVDPRALAGLRRLAALAEVPIVPVSLCSLADLAETLRWGRAIASAVRGRRRCAILAITGARQLPLLLGALGSDYRGRVSGCRPSGTGVAAPSRD